MRERTEAPDPCLVALCKICVAREDLVRSCSQRPDTDLDDIPLAVGDDDERRLQIQVLIQQNPNGARCERGADVARPQVDDAQRWLSCQDRQCSEIAIVSDDDTVLSECLADENYIVYTDEIAVSRIQDIKPVFAKVCHDFWMDVFVNEKGYIAESQEGASVVRMTSFLTTCAA